MLKSFLINYRSQKIDYSDYRYSSMSSTDNRMGCCEHVVGEAARNLLPWAENSLWRHLAKQLPQCEIDHFVIDIMKLNYVMPASGFL